MQHKKQVDPETLTFRVALNRGAGMGKIKMQTMTWRGLCDELSQEFVDKQYSFDAYMKLDRDTKMERKLLPGFFVGADFKAVERHKPNVTARTLITLDIDTCSVELFQKFLGRAEGCPIADLEYFLYTSRSHSPEKPHFRIILPQTCPVPPDQGEAAARILAKRIDDAMIVVDPVSFRINQLMYKPSRCFDAEFISHHNAGAVFDVETTLTEYRWHLIDNPAPRGPNESKDFSYLTTRKADPRTKRNIVGAFCRAWSIEDLIDRKFPDVYQEVPGQPGTYTYANATGAPGVRLFDDGLHIHSFHKNDHIAGRNVNAFDLAMAIMFGDRNTEEQIAAYDRGELRQEDLPSWKAMVKWARQDEAVAAEEQAWRFDADLVMTDYAEDMSEAPAEDAPEIDTPLAKDEKPTPREIKAGWDQRLTRDEKGAVQNTYFNVLHILKNDPKFANTYWYNELAESIVKRRRLVARKIDIDSGPIRDTETGDPLTNADLGDIRAILSAPAGKGMTGYGIEPAIATIEMALETSARRLTFHPMREMVQRLQWDRKPRVERFWSRYFGAEDTPMHREMARKFLVGLMARVFQPGHKFDYVPILKGIQGLGKSSAFRLLVGDRYFVELRVGFDDPKKFYEAIAGKLVVEIPELSQFSKNEVEEIKAAVTSGGEQHRGPWERYAREHPRQCVFFGTTNRDGFLRDDVNRRFWVIPVPEVAVDTKGIYRDRANILAEAYELYIEMCLNHDWQAARWLDLSLTKENAAKAELVAAAHRVDDGSESDAERIRVWLDTPTTKVRAQPGWRPDSQEDVDEGPATHFRKYAIYLDIAYFVFGHTKERMDPTLRREMAAAMRHLTDWTMLPKVRWVSGFGMQRCFRRTGPEPDLPL